tara:strand:+ start:189 stop:764 length:576 start_codon:yes stop_codon:yes gene_type:complete
MNDLYFINTFKRNLHQAERLKLNLINYGIKEEHIFLVLGYDLKENKNISKSKLCFHNFFDFILPKMFTTNSNCYYLEDHTEIYDNPEKYKKDNKLVWLGFMKKMSHYIVGAHLVFLHKDLIKLLHGNKENYRPCYIDRFFRNIGLKYNFLQIDKSITKIVPHHSLALNKIRTNPINKHFIYYGNNDKKKYF